MNLRTLGGLTLEGVGFRRPKPLLLLAYVACEGPTERRYLSELFWPKAANSRKSLTMALSQLRKAGPASIQTDDVRVWSEVDSDVGRLRVAAERKDWSTVVKLYRGPFLEGLEPAHVGIELEEWMYGMREELARNQIGALLSLGERAAGERDLGQAGAFAERAMIVSATAFPEHHDFGRLYALLLACESPRIESLREEAKALDRELPTSVAEARESLLASSRSTPPPRLPSHASSFVGRASELAQLTQRLSLSNSRLLSIVGAGGVGKTRLALELANAQADSGAWEGVHFIPLESVLNPDHVGMRCAEALGIQLRAHQEAVPQIRDAVAGSSRLMVLDNFEHLLGEARMLSDLVRVCPGLHLVVTSRARLNLDGESTLLLDGLALPHEPVRSPEDALRSDAVQLFVRRAQGARSDFVLDGATLGSVVRICELVGGMPLALEMTAAWVRALSCAEIADELSTGLHLLESPNLDRPKRHQSVQAAFELSWQLLAPNEQQMLRRLSVFHGGFRRRAAAHVARAELDALVSLVDRSLVTWNGRDRYELHPLLKQFLDQKARLQPDEAIGTREQHARYFLEMLGTYRDAFPHVRAGRASADIERDLPNILAAWDWAAGHGPEDLLVDALNPLAWFFRQRGRFHQGLAWSLIDLGRSPMPLLALRQLLWQGAFLSALGDQQEALTRIVQAIELADRQGERLDLARALRVAGMAYLQSDPPDEAGATSAFRRALALYGEIGDVEGTTMMLNNLAHRVDSPHDARALLHESLALAREAGETHAIAMILCSLAELQVFCTGDYPSALAAAEESLVYHEASGFTLQAAYGHLVLGDVLLALGHVARAKTVSDRTLDLCQSFQGETKASIRGAAFALRGHVQRLTGVDDDLAVETYENALAMCERGRPNGAAVWASGTSLSGLARIALRRGRTSEARAHAQEALTYLKYDHRWNSYCHPAIRWTCTIHLGEALALEGHHAKADRQFQDVLRSAHAKGQVRVLLEALSALASLRLQQGRTDDAIRIAAVVADHPACTFELRTRAEALLQGSPSSEAPAGSRQATLEEVISSVVQASPFW